MNTPRGVIRLRRKQQDMKHRKQPKPTTNVASGWREAQREVKRAVRVANAQRERELNPRGKRDDDE